MAFIEITTLSSREVIKGYIGRAIHTGTTTLMYWTVEAGADMPIHSHIHEQVAHVLKGKFELIKRRTQDIRTWNSSSDTSKHPTWWSCHNGL
jgi:quercetin dioxygenase-like cupin family protein